MTTTATTAATTNPIIGAHAIWEPGRYVDDIFQSGRYHITSANVHDSVPAGHRTLCGHITTTNDYAVELNSSADVCTLCVDIHATALPAPIVEQSDLTIELAYNGDTRGIPNVEHDGTQRHSVQHATAWPNVERLAVGERIDELTADQMRTVEDARRCKSWGTQFAWQTLTVSMLVAYWAHAVADWNVDVASLTRTVRSSARRFGWEDQYNDRVGKLVVDGDLVNPAWRPTVERITYRTAHDDNGTARHDTYGALCPTSDAVNLPWNCSADALFDMIDRVRRSHTSDLETFWETFHAQSIEREWCGEYESTCEIIHADLTRHGQMVDWIERETEYTVTLCITETRYVSVTTTARDADSASDYAVENWSDYDDGDRYGASVSDVEVDEVSAS